LATRDPASKPRMNACRKSAPVTRLTLAWANIPDATGEVV
jgi:hypothetical protein